jgi:hypothetical protein
MLTDTAFLRGDGLHAYRPFFCRRGGVESANSLPQMMHVLTEHFRRDQSDAAVGDEETLAIRHRIDADLESVG